MRKYLERQLASSGILIFKEKHGTRYFVCNTKADFCKAAMKVLRDRLESNYWYHDDELEPEEIAKQEAAAYAGVVYRQPKLCKDKTRATKISTANDCEAAYEFLYDRADCEYEHMEIEVGEEY